MAKKMLAQGVATSDIISMTGLSKEEIENHIDISLARKEDAL